MTDLVVLEAIPRLIGEQIQLRATDGDGVLLEDVTWTIPGRVVKAYDADAGEVTQLEEDDLAENPIEFHWIESGVFTVTATSAGAPWTARYAVSAPRDVSMTATISTVAVRESILALGNSLADPGIRVCGRATGAVRPGELFLIELARFQHLRRATTGAVEIFSSHEEWCLNVCEDAPDALALAVDASVLLIDDNSPTSELVRNDPRGLQFAAWRVAETYRTYLCFKSDRAGSIPVALKCLQWRFVGEASYSTADGRWQLDAGNAVNDGAAGAVELPSWGGGTTDELGWSASNRVASSDNANCYGYALGINRRLTPGTNRGRSLNDIGLWSAGGIPYAEARKTELLDVCVMDGLKRDGPGRCIAVYVHVYPDCIDFHFVRDENDGTWSHKPGEDPVENNFGSHTEAEIAAVEASHFCGFLYLPPWFYWREDEENYVPAF